MKNYSIASTKNNLSQLIHRVEEGRPVHITRRGKSVAVLLSEKDYQRMNQDKPSPAKALQAFLDDQRFKDVDIDSPVFDGLRPTESGRDIDL